MVDVGAGTGKFTAQLVPSGATVIAVEPIAEMRSVLHEHLPQIDARAGRAEELPLEDGSVDAIVAAQAFHWFTLPATADEFHRVLRPGGRVGVVWNVRDESADWVLRLDEIIAPAEDATHHPGAHGQFDLGPRFSPPQRASFSHSQRLSPEGLHDRVLSMSFIAALDEPARADVLGRVSKLAHAHPELAGRAEFELPYITTAAWSERL